MNLDLILFFGLAAIAIAAAVGMVTSRSAIYSALLLIVNFGVVAVFYLLLEAPFLALAQVTVYAGAIMVLFLFVIMLLGADRRVGGSAIPWQRPLAIGLGAALAAEALYVVAFRGGALPPVAQLAPGFGSPETVGLELFGRYLLPFEVTSLLLLVAMVGAIVLTRRRQMGV